MKRIASILVLLIFLVCGIVFLVKSMNKNNESKIESNETNTKVNSTEISQEGLSGMDYRGKVEDSQVLSEGELCVVNSESVRYKYVYSIQSCSIDKRMKSEIKENIVDYEVKNNYVFKENDETAFDSDGTIKDSYSYLYVNINMKCTEGDSPMLAPLTFKIMELEDGIVTDCLSNKYRDASYIGEMDGKDMINYMKVISPFKQGESCSFVLIYIVPDEVIKKNNLCINFGSGKYGKALITDKTQYYINLKLNEL